MRMVDLIHKKRENGELNHEEIKFFVQGVTDGSIPDYQISAFLMAVYFNGMTAEEQTDLTMQMVDSGDRVDLSAIPGIKVDKHSTGGVGDKVSLPLAALVASTGVPVPMISGRGLGHTGGTLDKLEAIPGYKVEIELDDFISQVAKESLAIIGATANIAPADKRIYAIRDVTDTVDSIPAIASSIMSKKIAAGGDALVIDIKTGAGAFMKTEESAAQLGEALVAIGKQAGIKTMVLISDMNQPLGNKVGNALEIEETIDLLKGNGPADLVELTVEIAAYMVVFGEKADSLEEARAMLHENIANGSALDRFKAMVQAQSGDVAVVDDYTIMPQAAYKIPYVAETDGVISEMTADDIGIASMLLGGGREKSDDVLDYAVGIELHKKVGDAVSAGDTILTIHANREEIDSVIERLDRAVKIGESAPDYPMIYQIIE